MDNMPRRKLHSVAIGITTCATVVYSSFVPNEHLFLQKQSLQNQKFENLYNNQHSNNVAEIWQYEKCLNFHHSGWMHMYSSFQDSPTIRYDLNATEFTDISNESVLATSKDSLFITNRPNCYYKNTATNNRWKTRIELNDLCVGQELRGIVVQQLLNGTTGPKIYFDCGVGRYRPNTGGWKIQTAMLRFEKGMKESVVKKKFARFVQRSSQSGDGSIPLYVSRIFSSSDRLEVVSSIDDVRLSNSASDTRLPASRLQTGQELIGTVKKLCDYGAFIDVNYNRKGLLHIQRVADLYGTYIPKRDGLKQYGIEIGSRIKVEVLTNNNKQLSLDFTKDVKELAALERNEQERLTLQQRKRFNKRESSKYLDLKNITKASSYKDTAATDTTVAIPHRTSTISSPVSSVSTAVANNVGIVPENNIGIAPDVVLSNQDDVLRNINSAVALDFRMIDKNDGYDEGVDDTEPDIFDDEDLDEYDSYDEEREIEDQLGLGTY